MSKTAFFSRAGLPVRRYGPVAGERFPEARATFEEADDTLGFPLSRLCFDGPEEELKLTENTQPALLTVSVAADRRLKARGISAGLCCRS